MEYELTEECYDICYEDFNEWSRNILEDGLMNDGIDGISGGYINVM